MAELRLRLEVRDLELRAREVQEKVVGRLPVGDRRLLPVQARELRDERRARLRLARLDAHEVVLLRLERVDLALALDEEPQRDGLHPARGERAAVGAGDVLPQERRHLVAHDAVEDAPRLLRVHERHVDSARLRDGLEDRGLRDLVVRHALERLLAGRGLEYLVQVPRDRLPLAVGIAREVYLVRGLYGRLEFGDDLLLAFGHDIRRREGPLALSGALDADRAVLLWQVADVPDRALDDEVAAKILAYRLRLRRRLDYQKLLSHCGVISSPFRFTILSILQHRPPGCQVRDATRARRGGGCLPVIRCLAGARPGAEPWCDIDFAVFYLFACACWPLGKKGDASKSGRPQGSAPSLIMLRNRPAPPALR